MLLLEMGQQLEFLAFLLHVLKYKHLKGHWGPKETTHSLQISPRGRTFSSRFVSRLEAVLTFGPACACQISATCLIPPLWNHCSMTSRSQYLHHVLCLWEAAVERCSAVGMAHIADEVLGSSSFGHLSVGYYWSCHPDCSPLMQSKSGGLGFLSWLPQRQHCGHSTAKTLDPTTGPLGYSVPWVLGSTTTMGCASSSRITGTQKIPGGLENLLYTWEWVIFGSLPQQ